MIEFDEYLKALKNDKSPNTVRSYNKSIGEFIAYFNIQTLDDIKKITSKDARAYQQSLINKGLKHSSINANMRPISAFLNWLLKDELIDGVVLDKLDSLKEPKKIVNFLTDEECDGIVNAAENIEDKAMILFMLTSAVRRFELVNIKISDIQGKYVVIHGKGNKERKLEIHPKVLELLPKILKKNKSEYLFVSQRGHHPISEQTVYNRIKNACKKSGMSEKRVSEIAPHDLRRTVLTNLCNTEGVNLFTVQQIAGHSSLNTTRRYVTIKQETIDNAISGMKGFGD